MMDHWNGAGITARPWDGWPGRGARTMWPGEEPRCLEGVAMGLRADWI